MSSTVIAVYPGTFDPVTYGHLDLMRRGCALFSEVIVAVAGNPKKHPMFSLEERAGFIAEATADLSNLRVVPLKGLLVDFARESGAQLIMKGWRAVSDFEFELQLAATNRRLAAEIESIFMMPAEEHSFISSTIVKEVSRLDGNVSDMAPPVVVEALKRYYAEHGNGE